MNNDFSESFTSFPSNQDSQSDPSLITNLFTKVKSVASQVLPTTPELVDGPVMSRPSRLSTTGLGVKTRRTRRESTSLDSPIRTRYPSSMTGARPSSQSRLISGPLDTNGTDREVSSDTESIVSTARNYFLARVDRRPAPLKSGGLGKEFWMKDENATECFGCSATFTSKYKLRFI